jgi:hypothetical protein
MRGGYKAALPLEEGCRVACHGSSRRRIFQTRAALRNIHGDAGATRCYCRVQSDRSTSPLLISPVRLFHVSKLTPLPHDPEPDTAPWAPETGRRSGASCLWMTTKNYIALLALGGRSPRDISTRSPPRSS